MTFARVLVFVFVHVHVVDGSESSQAKCSDFSVLWLLAQAGGGGCATENKFWDTKIPNAVVASSDDADVISSCCSEYADALCSDWSAFYGVCVSGDFVGTNAAQSDGQLTADEYQGFCCTSGGSESSQAKCSDFSVLWLLAQVGGGGCATENKFFDTKTLNEAVTSADEADVITSCCTPFADAVCSDWVASCDTGTYLQGSTSAPGEGDNGNTLPADWQGTCCSSTAKNEDDEDYDDVDSAVHPWPLQCLALVAVLMFLAHRN